MNISKHFASFVAALIAVLALAPASRAAILSSIPSPMAQGGMIHINTVFLDQASGTFDIHVDAGTPVLKPLGDWSPGDSFDPADPWYDELDPTQEGRLFNSRYGFLVDVANSDTLPSNTSIGIRLLSSTAGLAAYFYRATSGSEAFDQVFTMTHDYVLWTGAMWHPVFTATAPGNHSATFELFLANAPAAGNVDYVTNAGPVSGYSTAQVTLDFSAVPEPAAIGPVALAAATLAARRRRRSP